MVSGVTIQDGDLVKDTKIGLIWTVVGRDGEGTILVERNEVIASVSIWDLERIHRPAPEITGTPPVHESRSTASSGR
jgi:hypothetical protein